MAIVGYGNVLGSARAIMMNSVACDSAQSIATGLNDVKTSRFMKNSSASVGMSGTSGILTSAMSPHLLPSVIDWMMASCMGMVSPGTDGSQ